MNVNVKFCSFVDLLLLVLNIQEKIITERLGEKILHLEIAYAVQGPSSGGISLQERKVWFYSKSWLNLVNFPPQKYLNVFNGLTEKTNFLFVPALFHTQGHLQTNITLFNTPTWGSLPRSGCLKHLFRRGSSQKNKCMFSFMETVRNKKKQKTKDDLDVGQCSSLWKRFKGADCRSVRVLPNQSWQTRCFIGLAHVETRRSFLHRLREVRSTSLFPNVTAIVVVKQLRLW